MYVCTYVGSACTVHTYDFYTLYVKRVICFTSQTICDMTESIYIPRGVNVSSLSRESQWYFEPQKEFRVSTSELMHMHMYLNTFLSICPM